MLSVLTEFKQFVARGNVLDLAVGVVVGASFGRIVSSLVEHVMLPPLGLLIGGIDFSNYRIVLREAAGGRTEVALGVGMFLNATVQFFLVAVAIFAVVKLANRVLKKPDPPPAVASPEVELLREIRDLLKSSPR